MSIALCDSSIYYYNRCLKGIVLTRQLFISDDVYRLVSMMGHILIGAFYYSEDTGHALNLISINARMRKYNDI